MSQLFLEGVQVQPAGAPGASVTGDWVDMGVAERCAIVVNCPASPDADVVLTIKQATANDGTGSKAISLAADNGQFYAFNKADPTSDSKFVAYDHGSLATGVVTVAQADATGVFVIEIQDYHLDANSDYRFMAVDVASGTASCTVNYALACNRYGPAWDVGVTG